MAKVSKKLRKLPVKKSKKEARVGRWRDGTRGDLQLSIKSNTNNRNFANTQSFIKMSKDNLRSLKLLANKLDSLIPNKGPYEGKKVGVKNNQADGLRQHFVKACRTSFECFTKENLNKFPELLPSGEIVKGTGKNPVRQAKFCSVLEYVTKVVFKTESKEK